MLQFISVSSAIHLASKMLDASKEGEESPYLQLDLRSIFLSEHGETAEVISLYRETQALSST